MHLCQNSLRLFDKVLNLYVELDVDALQMFPECMGLQCQMPYICKHRFSESAIAHLNSRLGLLGLTLGVVEINSWGGRDKLLGGGMGVWASLKVIEAKWS